MLDYLEIFRELNSDDIRYIVCGEVAVNLYGIPRMTYDIDLLTDMDVQNIKKFIKLLKNWRFTPKLPVEIEDIADSKKRDKWVKQRNLKTFTLQNEDWAISEIDVIIDAPISYKDAEKNKIVKVAGNVKIPLVSIKDLIKMKEGTNRKQDESDVRYLKGKLNEG